MNSFRPICISALTLGLLFCSITCAIEKPNVVFISIDDLNDWIGCLGGHPQAKTPNIDRLAARGVLFTNAHCAAPACNPSRAAVFSGRMPFHTGIWSNDSPRIVQKYPDLIYLPTAFKNAGYRTMGTGKLLHSKSANELLFDRHYRPEQRWSPLTNESVRYSDTEQTSKGTDNPRHVVSMNESTSVVLPLNRMPSDRAPNEPKGESFDWGPWDVPDSEMGDAKITDWAINELKPVSSKPFFLAVGYYRPHIPLWAPRKYFELYPESVVLPKFTQGDLDDLSDVARKWAVEPITAGSHATVLKYNQWPAAVKAYLACVTFVDHQVGRLLDAIDTHANDNTLIVLWSDHGWHLGEKQHWGKWTGWERSTRVPLIVVPPRHTANSFAKAGSICGEPVGLIDLYPTLLELCGIKAPSGLDGESVVPLLKQPLKSSGRVAVTTFDPGNVTLRSRRWRYIRYADGSEELYDHERDPNEWTNMAPMPEAVAKLAELRNRVPAEVQSK